MHDSFIHFEETLSLNLGDGAAGCVFPDVAAVKLPPGVKAIVTPRQTHTSNVAVMTSPCRSFPEIDALITLLPDIAVGVRTADCVPVLLHAPDIRAVAVVHAGWKGTVEGIVEKTVQSLVSMGAEACNIYAAIGPRICGDCYNVSEELAARFQDVGLGGSVIIPSSGSSLCDGQPRIDLREANLIMLKRNGVSASRIYCAPACTRHTMLTPAPEGGAPIPAFPSWRRSPGTSARLLTVARLV